jgi:RecA/RadA recombinase
MSNPSLQTLIDATENEEAKISDSGIVGDVTAFIDTGSFALNALVSGSIYGGWPKGRVSALAGAEGTGKTFAAMSAISEFLQTNPDGNVLYFETEGAISKQQLKAHGIDTTRVGYIPISVIEDFKTQMCKVIDKYRQIPKDERMPLLVVLDSLGMMTTRKEAEDSLSGKEKKDMTRPGAIRSVFRTITLDAALLGITILMTNHTYEVIGSYVPTKEMAGGGGLKYAASTIVFLSKAKDRDSQKEVVGANVTCKLVKGRLTKEDKKIKTNISFETGLNRYEGLLPIAHEAKLVEKKGNKWVFPNCNPAFENAIKKNPTKYYTEELLQKIDAVCQETFKFGLVAEEANEVLPEIQDEE